MISKTSQAQHEIEHGQVLAQRDTELIWGWGTPAGKLRAKRRAEFIATGAQLGPKVRAIEIGCGTGFFTEIFAKTGANLVAVDISADLLKKAKARGLPANQVLFLEKQFEACDVDGPFDAVIGSSVLHHLDIANALAKIYELLKPGGIISFAEPNMLNPQVFMERTFRAWFPYISPDETAFVRWQLKMLLTELGFKEVEITPFDWLHPATPTPLINLVRGVGDRLEKMPVLREFAGSLYIRGQKPSS